MRPYNEADTRAKLIDPQLKLLGWGESQIEREHYFVKGRPITNGRIYLVGETSRRRQPRRVDYLLRYHGQMIAVIEAKDEIHSVDAGLEQAKEYARMLAVPFAYSSNGHGFSAGSCTTVLHGTDATTSDAVAVSGVISITAAMTQAKAKPGFDRFMFIPPISKIAFESPIRRGK